MWRNEQRILLIAGMLLLAAYSATLAVAHGLWLTDALPAGLANALPTLLFGAGAYWINMRYIALQPLPVQVTAHFVAAAVFALLTYWLLLVMLGMVNELSVTRFEVRPLISRAMAWQLLQNVTIYGVIALLANLRQQARQSAPTIGPSLPGSLSPEPLSRYFVRNGDELVPVDVDDIISIAGAGDYTEVTTATGRHLARMTLTGFERALEPSRFARVHRSRIVNLRCVSLAEAAGDGRLLLHLTNGEAFVTSRAGAVALRQHVL